MAYGIANSYGCPLGIPMIFTVCWVMWKTTTKLTDFMFVCSFVLEAIDEPLRGK